MTYYRCTSCTHTTIDHELHGHGACLITDCTCTKMLDGEEYVKPNAAKLSRDNIWGIGKKKEDAKGES